MEYVPVLSLVLQRLLAWVEWVNSVFFLCFSRPKAQVQIDVGDKFSLFSFFFSFLFFSFFFLAGFLF